MSSNSAVRYWSATPGMSAKKITLQYSGDCDCNYPTAGTCGLNLFLPTKHNTAEDFFTSMDKAFECELFGFPCY